MVNRLDPVGVALLDAARRLLTTEGAGALTVRRVAGEAGVSTMNVYSRFGGKDGVVEQLFRQGFELLAAEMDQVATTDDPIADLRDCGRAYRRFALGHEALYGVMFLRVVPDYEPTEEARAAALGTLDQLAARLERAMAHGRVRRIDPRHAAAVVWSTCHGVVSLELTHENEIGVDWSRVFDDATAAVVQGLAG